MNDSSFHIPNLAQHMKVTTSYLYRLVREGTLTPSSRSPIIIDEESLTDFYSQRIPTEIFNLKLKGTHTHAK